MPVSHPYTTDLLEYQAKELLSEAGVELLPAQSLETATAVRSLRLPYPIALKSQVRARQRAAAGGIRFAANAIDAFASARAIFNLAIGGELPEVLLAEKCFQSERDFYLAVVVDEHLQRPVLLGSPLAADGRPTACYRVAVEAEFSGFYARRLCLRLGLQGDEILRVSAILEKLFRLTIAKDLVSIEIDPLGIAANGEIAILDAKIRIDPSALCRHPDLSAWLPATETPIPHWHEPAAGEGLLLASNCESLPLALGDSLRAAGCTLPLGTMLLAADTNSAALTSQLRGAVGVLAAFGSEAGSGAEAILRAATAAGVVTIAYVVGGATPSLRQQLAEFSIRWCADLDTAIAAACEISLPSEASEV